MTLAMIARADCGGLGALCWDVWRHLRPERTLIVHTNHTARGVADLSRYPPSAFHSVRSCSVEPSTEDAAWLLDGVDIVWTAETWYGRAIPQLATKRGIRTALYAMPEMHDRREYADVIRVPTDWRIDLVPRAEVLPFPVARDVLPFRQRTAARVFYHVASNAMEDRNGTLNVLTAIGLMREPVRFLIRGPGTPMERRKGVVDLEWLSPHPGLYHEAWPDEADVLVQPRRFGGLSLPIQEAVSLGMPVVLLDTDPYAKAQAGFVMIPACHCAEVPMKGGLVAVSGCDPEELAATLDVLARTPQLVAGLSERQDTYAIDWGRAQAAWEAVLRPGDFSGK